MDDEMVREQSSMLVESLKILYTPETDTYFNLNFVFDESKKDSFYNKKLDRFKSAADLKEYMHGSFDVLYSFRLFGSWG